jgi:hypothetical protein
LGQVVRIDLSELWDEKPPLKVKESLSATGSMQLVIGNILLMVVYAPIVIMKD